MKALLATIQQVELVSDESWLSENLGAILVAIAAVLAASLAAWIANRNHKRQLAHDRYLQGQEHIRELIDAASAASIAADSSARDFVIAKGGTRDERIDLHNEAQGAVNAARGLTDRLKLRLGEESPIASKHEMLCDQSQTLITDEIERRDEDVAKEGTMTGKKARERGLWDDSEEAARRFRGECYKWFNESVEQSLGERFRRRRHMWAESLRSVR